jgi:hypothetical protein
MLVVLSAQALKINQPMLLLHQSAPCASDGIIVPGCSHTLVSPFFFFFVFFAFFLSRFFSPLMPALQASAYRA